MNKETILAMEPGREMDALVAEMMNLCVLDHVQGYGDGCVMSDVGFDEWMKHPMYGRITDPAILLPYSTDIAAAWGVVEKLREDENLKIVLEAKLFKGWYVCFKNDMGGNVTGMYEFDADAPEAICKAALIATLEANHET